MDSSLNTPCGQLEALNNQLAVEHRIKEGAENLLNMQLTVSFQCDTSVRSVC
jgi:hypothetical protein